MKFLRQEIAEPPADCTHRDKCLLEVRSIGVAAATMIALGERATPSSPQQEGSPDATELAGRAARFLGVLPAVAEKYIPAALRCAGCVIDCALLVLQDGGAV